MVVESDDVNEEVAVEEFDLPDLLHADEYSVQFFQPIWEPFNADAERIVCRYLDQLGLPQTPKKTSKYRVVVASLLYAARKVVSANSRSVSEGSSEAKPVYLGAAMGHDNWTIFPLVGRDVVKRTINAFVDAGLLLKVEGSGQRHFYETDNGRVAYEAMMTMWQVNSALDDDPDLAEARFIETGRPLVLVNVLETRNQKERRERFGEARKRLSHADCIRLFGDQYTASQARVEALCAYWKQHPLVFPDGSAVACATRVFSDGDMEVGGRLYGRWTNKKSEKRLEATIDGEPILSLDIAASQPTLLSVLLGVKLKISAYGTWYDVYTQLTNLWGYGATTEAWYERGDEIVKRNRTIAKGVVMELIGTGNVNKAKPSVALVEKTNITQEEWDYFKAKIIEAVPAMLKLWPRYDSQGNVSGYINGPAFLMYHESEIMMHTLERLRDDHDVPAYPVHDCLLVKEKDWEVGLTTFSQTISNYCVETSGTPVIVPIKREKRDGTKKTFRGYYDLDKHDQLSP
ncbi:MAG: hypothetical protein ACMUJJ_15685 [Roseicyclus sp.]|uniref:hypothetical protein n=1 Tax=Roseicyclus sp. TaxID=1914329 RepID=UPI003A84E02C